MVFLLQYNEPGALRAQLIGMLELDDWENGKIGY